MSHSEPMGARGRSSFRVEDVADHWGLVMGYGVVTLVLGLVLAVWPSETIAIVAVLVAIQLLATGVMRIVLAAWASSEDAAGRVLLGLTGGLALVVGLLCLRDPIQSVLVLGMIIGAWWLVAGVADVVGAVLSRREHRGWDIAGGLVGVLVGGFLLVNTDTSLRIFVVVLCVWLLLTGGIAVVIAWGLRAASRSAAGIQPTAPNAAASGPAQP